MNFDTDTIFVLGVFLGLMSFPAILSAYTHGRGPKAATMLVVASIALISYAVMERPSGYSIGEVPQVFKRVVSGALN